MQIAQAYNSHFSFCFPLSGKSRTFFGTDHFPLFSSFLGAGAMREV